jgi:hypothetical protein
MNIVWHLGSLSAARDAKARATCPLVFIVAFFAVLMPAVATAPTFSPDILQRLIALNKERGKHKSIRSDIALFLRLTTDELANNRQIFCGSKEDGIALGFVRFAEADDSYIFFGSKKNAGPRNLDVYRTDRHLNILRGMGTNLGGAVPPPVTIPDEEGKQELAIMLQLWSQTIADLENDKLKQEKVSKDKSP